MILVFSDTHNRTEVMEQTVKNIGAQASSFIHLGDVKSDTYVLTSLFTDTPLHSVAGNCDIYNGVNMPLEINTFIEGKKFFITHGHNYNVKTTLNGIINAAKSRGADVCLYGHTHVPAVFEKDGIMFINPGSAFKSRDTDCPTYGVITVNNGKTEAAVVMVENGKAKPRVPVCKGYL